ncbi:hypothetical protein M758_8G027900 [Ceratodon purpureus]|nr:hypothetical protein M758_8G027900 [Ceratodon purpureus]
MQSKRDEVPLRDEFMADQGKETGSAEKVKPRSRYRGCCIIAIVLVAILLVAVAVIIPTVVVPKLRDSTSQPPQIRGARAIVLACNATRFPQTCNASLTSNPSSLTSSPQGLATVAVTAAADAVSTSLTKATAYSIDPEVVLNASYVGLVDDCLNTLALAHEQLATSQATLSSKTLENLEPEYDTLKTSLSGALTFTGTCSDGLKAIPTLKSTDLRQSVNLTFQVVSNALAITNTLAAEGEDLQNWVPTYFLANLRGSPIPPSPSRRRMLEFTEQPHPFPNWLLAHDRRVLVGEVDPVPNVIVARDGSGNYTTIQAAVDAAPMNSSARYVIRIKAGVYDEIVRVSSLRKHVMFLGDGINQTIITGNRSVSMPGMTTFKSATVGVAGEGFMAKGITFQNTAGAEGQQAVALRVSADRCAVYQCSLDGFQDTLWAHAFRHFYKDCTIYGTVDFVFGNAAAVFQSCTLLARTNLPGKQNVFTAQGRTDPGQCTGLVIQNCTLGATPDMNLTSQLTYLGRPWKQFSLTVILQSYISNIVDPSGWLPFNGDFALNTLFYGEFGNTGPGANTQARVNWSTAITDSDLVKPLEIEDFLDAESWLPSAGVPYSEYSL